jgi:hypothetical protein
VKIQGDGDYIRVKPRNPPVKVNGTPAGGWILPVVSAVEAGTWRAVIVRYGYGPTDFWLLPMSEVDWLPRASEAVT